MADWWKLQRVSEREKNKDVSSTSVRESHDFPDPTS